MFTRRLRVNNVYEFVYFSHNIIIFDITICVLYLAIYIFIFDTTFLINWHPKCLLNLSPNKLIGVQACESTSCNSPAPIIDQIRSNSNKLVLSHITFYIFEIRRITFFYFYEFK